MSNKQLDLLFELYRFRFATTDLMAELVGKDRSTIYEAFYGLHKQGYIHKFYDKSYRLQLKPAIYALASRGITYLKNSSDLDKKILHNYYKNKSASDAVTAKYLNTFTIYLKLRTHLGDRFILRTKPEMPRGAFVNPLPELWLERRDKPARSKDYRLCNPSRLDYALDVYPAKTMSWILRKRLRAWCEFAEESNLEASNILLLAQNWSTEKRLFKMVEGVIQDFEFYVSQQELLMRSSEGDIWIDSMRSDEDDFIRMKLS